jgi:polyphosphate kinase
MTELFFNRELSWLQFNKRVLEEAYCEETPLFERLKFVSIFASNLDEFYMVRVGTLLDQSLIDGVVDHKTLMTPDEQIKAINKVVKELYPLRDSAYRDIMTGLSKVSMYHTNFQALNGGERRLVETYFNFDVLPVLSPQIIDTKHPLPHLESRQMYIGVRLKSKDERRFGIIPLPRELERIFIIPNSSKFLLLEDIMLYFVKNVFDAYSIEAKAIFRVTRSADIEPDSDPLYEETNYREVMNEMLKKRRKLSPVRLEVSSLDDEPLLNFFLKILGLSKSRCFLCEAPLDLSFVYEIEKYLDPRIKESLLYRPLRPQWPGALSHTNIIQQIKYSDFLLSYPYDSMQPLIELIREASLDSEVVSIKMTLYRISNNSQIVQHLCNAAENGKSVTVVIELRARFDEQNNINWSKILEESGCNVIYGVDNLKVHSKILLITRKAHSRPQYIVNIATGNYNESTARFYADLSFITTDPAICEDAQLFFNDISIGNVAGHYKRLLVAPKTLKPKILEAIEIEKQKASEGGDGRIIAKMNSLTDKDIIDALISASQSGVEISLIIRGICCLRPGVENYTDHIEVISIVGRFLEHARIYAFGTGDDTKVFIGSADMMTRNTENRVEVLAPIEDRKLKAQLIEMLNIQLKDNVKARILNTDGDYVRCETANERLDSQIYFFEKAYLNLVNPIREDSRDLKVFLSNCMRTLQHIFLN